MSNDVSTLAIALKRLGSAIDQLDQAASRKQSNERASAARATELEMMREDRAKLADLLDQALARGRSLETATQDISARLEMAISMTKEALDHTASSSEG
jgi:hypothetical protein